MNINMIAATALAFAAQSAAADEIRVLNWQGYGTDIGWSLEAFQAATGHTVVHEYFNSEQEMLTKLRTNPGAYDVVMINAAFTEQAKTEGLIAPIDVTTIANFADITPAFATDSKLVYEDQVYGRAMDMGSDLDRGQHQCLSRTAGLAGNHVGSGAQGPRLDPR